MKLRAVWWFSALLLTYRLGVLVAESAFSLKLIDKGVPKETLAALVLFQVTAAATKHAHVCTSAQCTSTHIIHACGLMIRRQIGKCCMRFMKKGVIEQELACCVCCWHEAKQPRRPDVTAVAMRLMVAVSVFASGLAPTCIWPPGVGLHLGMLVFELPHLNV